MHEVWCAAVVLATAYALYEGVLFAATALMPATHASFAPLVVTRIFGINPVAGVIHLVVQYLMHRLVLAPHPSRTRPIED